MLSVHIDAATVSYLRICTSVTRFNRSTVLESFTREIYDINEAILITSSADDKYDADLLRAKKTKLYIRNLREILTTYDNDKYNKEYRKNLIIYITLTKELNFVINILSINVNRYKRESYITK